MAEAKKRARKKAAAPEETAAAPPAEVAAPGVVPADLDAPEVGPLGVPASPTAVHVVGVPERIVVFMLEDQSYALPIDRVQEIQQLVALSSVPGTSAALVGMVNLRGLVVPAIDLRIQLGMPSVPYGLQTAMVITRANGHLVAFVVDGVEDVVELDPTCVQPPSPLHGLADNLVGVCRMSDRLVFLLDIDRVVPAAALKDAPVAGGEA